MAGETPEMPNPDRPGTWDGCVSAIVTWGLAAGLLAAGAAGFLHVMEIDRHQVAESRRDRAGPVEVWTNDGRSEKFEDALIDVGVGWTDVMAPEGNRIARFRTSNIVRYSGPRW